MRVVAVEKLLALCLEETCLLVDGDRVPVDVWGVEHVAEIVGAYPGVLNVDENVFENHNISVLL